MFQRFVRHMFIQIKVKSIILISNCTVKSILKTHSQISKDKKLEGKGVGKAGHVTFGKTSGKDTSESGSIGGRSMPSTSQTFLSKLKNQVLLNPLGKSRLSRDLLREKVS